MHPEPDRVRRRTAADVLRRIDQVTTEHLAAAATEAPDRVQARLERLDREWDIDRSIELEAATMGLFGLALGTVVSPRLRALPGIVAAALCLYATTGRYPLLPVFRRLGVRTALEIERERYALKALRGDFDGLRGERPAAAVSGADIGVPTASGTPSARRH
jgi:hypothetical protein